MKYSTFLVKLPILLCIVGCIVLGCKKEKEIAPPNDSLVQKNVSIADISLNNLIVDLDSAKISFEGSHYLLDTIAIGDIIVSGIHKNAPLGYAVLVTDMNRSGSKTTLYTRFAALTEIFKEVKINATYPFSIDDTLRNSSFDFAGTFSIGNTTLISDCHINPTLIFDLEIQESKLIYSKIGVELNSTYKMDVNFTGVDSEARIILMPEKRIKPFTVLVYGVPIVVTPKIAAYAVANCSATVNVNAKIEGEASFKAFSEFTKESGWTPSSTSSFSSNLTDFFIDDNISVKFLAAIEPELTITLYNVDALRAVITTQNPYFLGAIDAKVDSCSGQPSIECEASAGINARGNFIVKGLDGAENIFGHQIFNFEKNVGQGICGCPGSFELVEISADSCDNKGTPDDDSDDTFFLKIFVDASDVASEFNLKVNCHDLGNYMYRKNYFLPVHKNEVADSFEVRITDKDYNSCIKTQKIEKPCCCPLSIIDIRDGQEYPTVKIGNKCWMAKNLNVGNMKVVNNILFGTSSICKGDIHQDNQLNNNVIEKYCIDNDPANCESLGGLYQWNEVMQYNSTPGTQGICPKGWHVPTDEEWKKLEIAIGMSPSEVEIEGFRGSNQGDRLKSLSACFGNSNCGDTGFNAIMTRWYESQGIVWGSEDTFFWTSTECSNCTAWERYLRKADSKISRGSSLFSCEERYNKYNAFSCRCVKD